MFTQNRRGKLETERQRTDSSFPERADGGAGPQNRALSPVGLPDVQGVWVRDAPFVSLLLQEVKEVFDSQGRAVRRDAEDGLKEVIQELLKSSLRMKRRKKAVTHEQEGTILRGGWFDSRGSDVLLTNVFLLKRFLHHQNDFKLLQRAQ